MIKDHEIKRLFLSIDHLRIKRLLLKFLKIPSPTGKEKTFSEFYAQCLKEIGFKVMIDRKFPESPNIIAMFKGARARPVLQFDGHTDTIVQAHPQPYFKDKVIYGRGACDMKGALAAMVESARVVIASGLKLNGSIMITAHGLHEAPIGMNEPLADLIKKRYIGDAVVVGECAHNTLPVEGNGLALFEIAIKRKGPALHELKGKDISNPILVGNEILSGLKRRAIELSRYKSAALPPSLFVGIFEGGDFYNRIPNMCRIVGTYRFPCHTKFQMVAHDLNQIASIGTKYKGIKIETKINKIGEGFKIITHDKLVESLTSAYHLVTGKSLKAEAINIAGNLPPFIKAGVPGVYHGVAQTSAHADLEQVSLKEVERVTKVYIALIIKYLGSA